MGRSAANRSLLASVLVSAADQAGDGVPCDNYSEMVVYMSVTAKAGTSPTVDFDIQTSHDNSAWHKHTSMTQLNDPTVTTTYRAPAETLSNLGKFVRIISTAVGGSSTPSLTCEAEATFKD